MIIAVASGKGGTGKTTVSAALSLFASGPVALLDCDVEEPNAAIFMGMDFTEKENVEVFVPSVDKSLCTGCGACSSFCRYNAIAVIGKNPLVFPDMCHSCGGCSLVCPVQAITEKPVIIGSIETGSRKNRVLVQGLLTIGHAMSPPLIRAVKKRIDKSKLIIIDCPPGTSCPMITAVRGSDFIILVTEPTPFGLHDLSLAVETVRKLSIPFGVIINRSDSGNSCVEEYCGKEKIRVLIKIPESRQIAYEYSTGRINFDCMPEIQQAIQSVPSVIQGIIAERTS